MTRLLLVDDEPMVLELQKRLLVRANGDWDVVCAPGGEQALAELDSAAFDVVVSDMRMPGMDGAELLSRVRERWPGIVRIIQSGHCEHDASLRAAAVAHQFFPKPLSPGAFREALLRVCSLRDSVTNPKLKDLIGSAQSLPSPPQLYLELTQCLSEDYATVEQVGAIIKQDVAMCAKTLQLVRSAYFGLSRDTTSIDEAVTVLGFNLIKSLVLVVGIFDIPWAAARIPSFSMEYEQQHALKVARATRVICAGTSLVEDAMIAGMLHDVGKLVLASTWPEEYDRLLEAAKTESLPLHEVEQRELGVSHADVGAYLLGIWGLPYSIVQAVASHHSPRRGETRTLGIAGAVHIANALVHWVEDPCASHDDPLSAIDGDFVKELKLCNQVKTWQDALRDGGDN